MAIDASIALIGENVLRVNTDSRLILRGGSTSITYTVLKGSNVTQEHIGIALVHLLVGQDEVSHLLCLLEIVNLKIDGTQANDGIGILLVLLQIVLHQILGSLGVVGISVEGRSNGLEGFLITHFLSENGCRQAQRQHTS